MIEEWFMLLLLCFLLLLFKVWQRSCSCCWCYIVYNFCFRFYRGMVCNVVVVILYIITAKVWQRSGSFCCCNIVYYYCLKFDRGVVHVVVFILSNITVQGLTGDEFMLLLLYCLPLLFKVWQRSGSCCCGWLYCMS